MFVLQKKLTTKLMANNARTKKENVKNTTLCRGKLQTNGGRSYCIWNILEEILLVSTCKLVQPLYKPT